MSGFRELKSNDFKKFLAHFTKADSLKYRNNKWVGLNENGEPFTVHVQHGNTRKYPVKLVEAVAKDLGISREEFDHWFTKVR